MNPTKRFTIWKVCLAIPITLVIAPMYLIFDNYYHLNKVTIPQFIKDIKVFLDVKDETHND